MLDFRYAFFRENLEIEIEALTVMKKLFQGTYSLNLLRGTLFFLNIFLIQIIGVHFKLILAECVNAAILELMLFHEFFDVCIVARPCFGFHFAKQMIPILNLSHRAAIFNIEQFIRAKFSNRLHRSFLNHRRMISFKFD